MPIYFTGEQYKKRYPDLMAAGVDPFQHYVQYGKNEGRDISFPEGWTAGGYLNHPGNWDVTLYWLGTPEDHWLLHGVHEGRSFIPNWEPTPEPIPITDDAFVTGGPTNLLFVLRSSAKFSGAFDSLVWNGKEFLNNEDFGRELQSACAFDDLGEAFNPTEAGSGPDFYTGVSSSRLLERSVDGNKLHSKTQMAFWNPVNSVALSNHTLTKDVVIGDPSSAFVIKYTVKFHVPEDHWYGQFEALTAYMPSEFSAFHLWDKAIKNIVPTVSNKESWGTPGIVATADGNYAMGCYSPDEIAIWTAYNDAIMQNAGCIKWNMVFREKPCPVGDYTFTMYVIVGSLENVRVSMHQLHDSLTPPVDPKGWRELVECRNPVSPYFSVEWPLMGTYGYQGGEMSSEIYKAPHDLYQPYQSESVIMIQDGIVLLENYGPERRGAIWYGGSIRWQAPGSLCLECHKHGDRWYVTWGDWNNPSAPGGWVWSTDKVNWHDGGRMQNSDMCFGMCTQGDDLCSFGSAWLDWGFDQSYPVLYRDGNPVDALPLREGDGA